MEKHEKVIVNSTAVVIMVVSYFKQTFSSASVNRNLEKFDPSIEDALLYKLIVDGVS